MSDTATNAESYRVTADELRQFIGRMKRLDMEKKTSRSNKKRSWQRQRAVAIYATSNVFCDIPIKNLHGKHVVSYVFCDPRNTELQQLRTNNEPSIGTRIRAR